MGKWYIDKGPDSDVVVSSRVRLARNFEAFPFPRRSSPEDQHQVIQKTKEALFSGNPRMAENFSLVEFKDLTDIEKQILVEKRLVSKELAESSLEVGALLSSDEQISIMLNEEDHLRIQCLMAGMQLEQAFALCDYLDSVISEKVDYAFDSTIGYLTSCPTNIGTALRASLMLHLPALSMTGYIRTVLESCGKLGIAVRGMYGENTEAHGNLYQLSNQITLGNSEQDIVMSMKAITLQIIEQERLLRSELFKRNGSKLEDRIMRSLGVLRYARVLTADEALQKLSDVRLGIHLGLVEELDETDINEMMLKIQPGGLWQHRGKPVRQDERDLIRAAYIREHIGKKHS